MEKTCVVCNLPLNYIKAGVSKKTGRPYNAFWACPDGHKQTDVPVQSYPIPSTPKEELDDWQPAQKPTVSPNVSSEVPQQVWESKDLRIARESCIKSVAIIVAAAIGRPDVAESSLSSYIDEIILQADKLVEYVYQGKKNAE